MRINRLQRCIMVGCIFLGTGCRAQEIALTFDDAPTESSVVLSGTERTGRILAHLAQHRIEQAAFFVVTRNLDNEGAKRLQQYAAAGHLLANHTHSHQWIRNLGTQAYILDILKADSILKTYPHYTPWFRYPFLDEGRTISTRDSIRHALQQAGLSNGYVTVDNYDWYINHLFKQAFAEGKQIDYTKLKAMYIDHIWNSIQFYDSIAKKALNRSPRHVLLLHENDLAAYFLGDLIIHIRAQGWKIISPTDAYTDPIAASVPDVLFNGQGRVAALAFAQKIPARELVQEAEDENYLEQLSKQLNIFRQR